VFEHIHWTHPDVHNRMTRLFRVVSEVIYMMFNRIESVWRRYEIRWNSRNRRAHKNSARRAYVVQHSTTLSRYVYSFLKDYDLHSFLNDILYLIRVN
jgi:hypothetical protein